MPVKSVGVLKSDRIYPSGSTSIEDVDDPLLFYIGVRPNDQDDRVVRSFSLHQFGTKPWNIAIGWIRIE